MRAFVGLILSICASGAAWPADSPQGSDAAAAQWAYLVRLNNERTAERDLAARQARQLALAGLPATYRDKILGNYYYVKSSDKTVMSLVLRWAGQSRLRVVLNGQPVTALSDYKGQYVDYPLIESAAEIVSADLSQALKLLSKCYENRTPVPIVIERGVDGFQILSRE